jgi:CRISPR-associated protein Cas2
MKDKLYLFCYDFPSTPKGNKRRAKIVKILNGHGNRVQKSVFEARFKSKDELEKMIATVLKVIVIKEDSLRVYPFNEEAEKEIRIFGDGAIFEREDIYIF